MVRASGVQYPKHNCERTRFDYVVASLDPEFSLEVRDLILAPPDGHPYSTLKDQLIKRTAASEQRRLQQLLTAEELGDRKPTQLLRRMQQLLGDAAGSNPDNSFLRVVVTAPPWSRPHSLGFIRRDVLGCSGAVSRQGHGGLLSLSLSHQRCPSYLRSSSTAGRGGTPTRPCFCFTGSSPPFRI